MEIRQVLKSSASMIPVLFYKVSDGQTKPGGEERYREREAGGAEEGVGRIKDEQRVDFRRKAATIRKRDVANHGGEFRQEG